MKSLNRNNHVGLVCFVFTRPPVLLNIRSIHLCASMEYMMALADFHLKAYPEFEKRCKTLPPITESGKTKRRVEGGRSKSRRCTSLLASALTVKSCADGFLMVTHLSTFDLRSSLLRHSLIGIHNDDSCECYCVCSDTVKFKLVAPFRMKSPLQKTH